MQFDALDGVYNVTFAAHTGSGLESGDGLAVVRDGRIFGSDPFGGIFDGRLEADQDGRAVVRLNLQVPPHGELVTGFTAGARGACVVLATEISSGDARSHTTVDIAGEPVLVGFERIGELPR